MNWIMTYSGRRMSVTHPDPSQVDITDIAVSLSRQVRFCGHTQRPYSVAQHSVICSTIVDPEHALQALLHDATEAYVSDVAGPVKSLCPDYAQVEKRIWWAIAKAFGVPELMHSQVKQADLRMLATERRDLLKHTGPEWDCLKGVEPLPFAITPWEERQSYSRFYSRFMELAGGMAA